MLEGSGEGPDDDETYAHSETTDNDKWASTELVHDEEGGEGSEEHADADYSRSEQGSGGTTETAAGQQCRDATTHSDPKIVGA